VHPVLHEMGNMLGVNLLADAPDGREAMQMAVAQRSSLHGTDARLAGEGEKFDDIIARAVEWCPGLSPSVLKGLLAQESGFDPDAINKYGYAGIAQIGRDEAREAGLHVGIAGSRMDERLNPYKAIPATARLLNMKAQRLGASAFSRYGQPAGIDFWNFVLAAYNGGEATVTLAMGHAHRRGLSIARASSLVGNEAVSFARNYASRWDNLLDGGSRSPLGQAVSRYFPDLASNKYREISSYPNAILARSLGQLIGPH
jgi:soluble lytic murein transglycosylase-like protein